MRGQGLLKVFFFYNASSPGFVPEMRQGGGKAGTRRVFPGFYIAGAGKSGDFRSGLAEKEDVFGWTG
jgi:hypothetical protein